MKTRLLVILPVLVLFSLPNLLVAKELKPFECMQPYVQDDWGGSHQEQATVFNKERDRLGKSFGPELMKFIGANVESHYWVSAFITEDVYLQNHAPLKELGLLLLEQGLILCGASEEYAVNAVSFHVLAAILAQKMNLNPLAVYHKDQANSIIKDKPILAGGWPALDDADRDIFDSIPYKYVEKPK
jgi:hypothetical protein